MLTALSTKVSGKTTCNTDREKSSGLTRTSTRVSTSKAKSKEKANTNGAMAASLRANGLTIKSTASESTDGRMAEDIKVILIFIPTGQGTWKDNNMHGKGVYTWADGRVYDGEY